MTGRKENDLNLTQFFFMLMPLILNYLAGVGAVDAPVQAEYQSLIRGSARPNDRPYNIGPQITWPAAGREAYGKMTFYEDHQDSNSGPTSCTCTCYPVPDAPPRSQRSPIGRKRSPPTAIPSRSPDYSSPAPPTSTKSPVTFSSPPPPAPYESPDYGEPSPVVAPIAAPENVLPSPSPPY